MTSGGGGGRSSKDGGAKEGTRSRCMGRGGRSFDWYNRWAAGGRERPPDPDVKLGLARSGDSSVGSLAGSTPAFEEGADGAWLTGVAPGHLHSYDSVCACMVFGEE